MSKAGRPRKLSRILQQEWESIPNTPDNEARRESVWKKLKHAQEFELKLLNARKAVAKAKEKAKKLEPKVASLSPTVQDFLDKVKGEK